MTTPSSGNYPATSSTPAADETYQVTISNVGLAGNAKRFTYTVTTINPDAPTVSLTPLKPVAYKHGKRGRFLVTRSGDVSTDLTVAYSVGGTAAPAVAYKALDGHVDDSGGQRLGQDQGNPGGRRSRHRRADGDRHVAGQWGCLCRHRDEHRHGDHRGTALIGPGLAPALLGRYVPYSAIDESTSPCLATFIRLLRRQVLLHLLHHMLPMPAQPAPETELLRAAYAAFNARDIDAALVLMTPDVTWPKAFKGGFVCGPEEVRAYWTQQWSEIDPHVEPVSFSSEEAGRISVVVHQVVRDLAGVVLIDEQVGHRFILAHGLIQSMEVGATFIVHPGGLTAACSGGRVARWGSPCASTLAWARRRWRCGR